MAGTGSDVQLAIKIAGKIDPSYRNAISGAEKSATGLGGTLKKIAGAAAAAFSFAKIGSFAKECIEMAGTAQKVQAQQNAVLASTKGAAGMTAKGLNDLAAAQSKVTTFSAGTTKQAENMLLTFTGIHKDVFPQTIRAAEDMATAMGTDATSAAKMLGKALNDPSAGLAKLTKQGVTFTASQKKQIQAMQKAGNTAGAQNLMLQELEKEFGGSAKAAGATLEGQAQITKNQMAAMKVSIGASLLPAVTALAPAVTGVVSKVASVISAHKADISKIAGFVSSVIGKATELLFNKVIPAIESVAAKVRIFAASPAFQQIKSNVMSAIKASIPVLQAMGKVAVEAFTKIPGVVQNVVKAFKSFGSAVATHKTQIIAVAGVITAIFLPALIRTGVQSVVAGTKMGISFVGSMVKTAAQAVVTGATMTANLIRSIIAYAASGWKAVASTTAQIASMVAQKAAVIASSVATKAATAAQWLMNAALNANPIGIVIVAIAALVGALVLLYNKNKAFRDFVNNMWAAIKGGWMNLVHGIEGIWKGLNPLQWGKDLMNGLVNGIKSGIKWVTDAVKGVADKIKSFLHFSRPDTGPLADYEKWMPDMMNGIAGGITANKYKVTGAIQGLSSDMTVGVKAQLQGRVPSNGYLGAAMGRGNSSNPQTAGGAADGYVYAPHYVFYGSANRKDVESVTEDGFKKFKEYTERLRREHARVDF